MESVTIAGKIDHTLLKPDATPPVIEKLCEEALTHRFAAVCVNPVFVPSVASILKDSGVATCTVSGFPLGTNTTASKVHEAAESIGDGATEIDMVLSIGALKSGDYGVVETDIAAVADICHDGGALLKVIIEAVLLTDEEKKTACRLIVAAGADFVKTSTGFASGGATVEDVMLMKKAVNGSHVQIKAAGGIRSYNDAVRMIQAGADRIGTSAGVQIVGSGA